MGFGVRDRDTYPRLANLTLANLVPPNVLPCANWTLYISLYG